VVVNEQVELGERENSYLGCRLCRKGKCSRSDNGERAKLRCYIEQSYWCTGLYVSAGGKVISGRVKVCGIVRS
jgi:hypothetical protein